jgi:hypothetical protein
MFLVLLKGDTSSHYSIYRQKVGNQERIVNRVDVFPSHADIIVTLKGSNAVHPVFRVRADAILKDSEFRGLWGAFLYFLQPGLSLFALNRTPQA